MDTKAWGSALWKSMFIIATNYPEKIDENNKEHLALKNITRPFIPI